MGLPEYIVEVGLAVLGLVAILLAAEQVIARPRSMIDWYVPLMGIAAAAVYFVLLHRFVMLWIVSHF